MNINCMFQFKKVQKMQNLGNVYIWGSPFVMSRTDAQNGVDSIFKFKFYTYKVRVSTGLEKPGKSLNWGKKICPGLESP